MISQKASHCCNLFINDSLIILKILIQKVQNFSNLEIVTLKQIIAPHFVGHII